MRETTTAPDHVRQSALELLEIARKGRPNVRYAVRRDYQAIGAFDPAYGCIVPIAILRPDGVWADMGHILTIDGKPAGDPAEWLE